MVHNLTNETIYNCATVLVPMLQNTNQYIPAKTNFILCKNIGLLRTLTEEIDQSRRAIIMHYGQLSEDEKDLYTFEPDKLIQANSELEALINLKQEVNLTMLKLSDLDGLVFTPQQMQALLIMIDEDEKE